MGRRKIEIKAIKDDRNRSVTFLKRKGGLFKKAHELSVLCSVDVAVFIFGSNKKLYEYSSSDMRELITRYTYHGGPNEHKGPTDFNGGGEDDEDEDETGTPPQPEMMDPNMMPPHFQGQAPFPPHMRGHTPSASPPIPNGVTFPHMQRSHTPQSQMGSRPTSRNDMRRMGPNMMPQAGGPPAQSQTPPINGYAFIQHPPMYNPQNGPNMPPNMPPNMAHPGPQYPYPPQQAHPPHMQQYMEDQRPSSLPPNFPPHGPQPGAPPSRHSVSPPQPQPTHIPQHNSHPPQPQAAMASPPQPQVHIQPPHVQIHEPPAPPPAQPKSDPPERPQQPPLLDTGVKKLPQRKQHSIFTPIDENRSVLSQHLAAFHGEGPPKPEPLGNRAQSVDVGAVSRGNGFTTSPPAPKRTDTSLSEKARQSSLASIPENGFTPPSRANSLRVGGSSRPQLRVQIPDEASDAGSGGSHSISPRNPPRDTASLTPRPNGPEGNASGIVLPPPSPSASALLSAGASGPPNPFARPPPQQSNMNIDTPVSALPSRFLNNEFLPSPSSFYPEWNFRGNDNNTLPSPLNFATPVVGSGPSFLRDENNGGTGKRKSPDISGLGPTSDAPEHMNEPKRLRIES